MRRPALGSRAFAASIAVAAAALWSTPVEGQELSDSLQDVVRGRLERLARALGDSTGLVPDSLALDSVRAPAAPDSVLAQLFALDGYTRVEYEAAGATFSPESSLLTLVGSETTQASLNRDGVALRADSALVFDEGAGRLTTIGEEATFTPEDGEEVLTSQIIYDLDEERATAVDAETKMGAGAGNWIVSGDCPWVDGDVSFCHDMHFTSCEEEEPHYHFVAREIKMTPGGTLVARNVLLYFGDVGVFWLPFIAQSTNSERRSGLLPIRFSVNDVVRTSDSYSRRVSNIGYYWAISDYADAQATVDWWSGNYVGLDGSFRYDWKRQFLDGNIDLRQYWREEGDSELAINTSHRWEISERTRAQVSLTYVSNSSFVRDNSFDPREVTQDMNSEAGISKRFGWGNLSMNASRRQFLSDDKVEMTLPAISLSVSPITLFPAAPGRGRFYNNMSWSSSGSLSRRVRDLPPQEVDSFSLGMADSETLQGTLRTGLNVGPLSISQNVRLKRDTDRDVPPGFFDPDEGAELAGFGVGSVGDLQSAVGAQETGDSVDHWEEELSWSTSVGYRLNLVGSTSITPGLSLSGRAIRFDTLTVGNGAFVSAPTRISFGAGAKADLYGFYYGDRIRHKWSPSFDYAYSPEVEPTQQQIDVFGAQAVNPRNQVTLGMTQTIEMKVEEDEDEEDELSAQSSRRSAGPRRMPRARKVTILGLRTSAVTYDFEEASETGHRSRGFAENLSISNQISSDYLRGLSLSMDYDIFESPAQAGGPLVAAPFMSSANLSFSLSHESSIFGWLRWLTGGDGEDESASGSGPDIDDGDDDDPTGLETADLGESTVVPRSTNRSGQRRPRSRSRGSVGEWRASLAYSLARSRIDEAIGSKMIQANVAFQPTEKWSVDWRTSYDLVAGSFNDHVIQLRREMHRWEASFDFRQTATGNWTFVFEVALSDNRDLHFDYEQRTGGSPRR